MKIVKKLVCLTVALITCITITVQDAYALSVLHSDHSGQIRCDKKGQLFKDRPYNHFHFQSAERFVYNVTVTCDLKVDDLPTSFEQVLQTDFVTVSELFLKEEFKGEITDISCSAHARDNEGGDAPVKFSATTECGKNP